MNNAVYGKTMENFKKQNWCKTCKQQKRLFKLERDKRWAEGTKMFDSDKPRLLEKALLGKELHQKLILLTKTTKTVSEKC